MSSCYGKGRKRSSSSGAQSWKKKERRTTSFSEMLSTTESYYPHDPNAPTNYNAADADDDGYYYYHDGDDDDDDDDAQTRASYALHRTPRPGRPCNGAGRVHPRPHFRRTGHPHEDTDRHRGDHPQGTHDLLLGFLATGARRGTLSRALRMEPLSLSSSSIGIVLLVVFRVRSWSCLRSILKEEEEDAVLCLFGS